MANHCRVGERGGFPWLTASQLSELILFEPLARDAAGGGDLPTHVRTPEVLKAVVRERDNKAGVYGVTLRRGRIEVGQPVYFEPRGRI